MKKIIFSLTAICACLMVACGNAEIDKINQLVAEAAEKTAEAASSQEVAEIAEALQAEMDKITEAAGEKLTFGKGVDKALSKYQKTAAKKLAEFGIELK